MKHCYHCNKELIWTEETEESYAIELCPDCYKLLDQIKPGQTLSKYNQEENMPNNISKYVLIFTDGNSPRKTTSIGCKMTGRVWTSTIRNMGKDEYKISVFPIFHQFVDITTKGYSPFAPGWDIVMGLKEGRITWDQYKEEYLKRLRILFKKDPKPFFDLLVDGTVLCCYCRTPEHCHRSVLAEVLVKIGKSRGIEVTYKGEL